MREDIERYLLQRQQLGYKDQILKSTLRQFVEYCESLGEKFMRNEVALGFLKVTEQTHPSIERWRSLWRLSRYLHAEDLRHDIIAPPAARNASDVRVPYIYDPDEIVAIAASFVANAYLSEIDALSNRTLIGLLSCTGMRIGEALKLVRSDYLGDRLHIRGSKWSKDRVLLLHPSVIEALDAYVSQVPECSALAPFFSFHTTSRYQKNVIERRFRKVVDRMGLDGGPGTGRPRIHDLRHTFATRALERCPHDEIAISRHIVALSEYLGHASLQSTYWYLRMTPQLKRRVVGENHDV